jgi:hypothetical protein
MAGITFEAAVELAERAHASQVDLKSGVEAVPRACGSMAGSYRVRTLCPRCRMTGAFLPREQRLPLRN